MATIVQGTPQDEPVLALHAALVAYEKAFVGAEAALYRQNTSSIRVRVIDRRFEGMAKSRRHAQVWEFLAARVPEDTMSEVSVVLAIAPAEIAASLANLDFDHPIASTL